MKKIFLTLAIIFSLSTLLAQSSVKFGHVDYKKATDSIPSKLQADRDMKQFIEEGQKTIQELQTILQQDYEKYIAERDSMSALRREITEKNLQEQQANLEYKQTALQNDLEVYDTRYYKPIEENFKKAVSTVSKKYKLNYVFDVSTMQYHDGGLDITEEVKQELLRLETARTTGQ